MREKLLNLMKSEGLKPSQLAELLEINPAGISHILAGRNKPGFDLLQKILRRFPRINPDWLLLDSNRMYRDDVHPNPAPAASSQTPAIDEGLFAPVGTPRQESSNSAGTPPPAPEAPARSMASQIVGSRTDASIRKIVLFYDDLTFESYTPAKQ